MLSSRKRFFEDTRGVFTAQERKEYEQSLLSEEERLEELVFGRKPFLEDQEEIANIITTDYDFDHSSSDDSDQENEPKKSKDHKPTDSVWYDEDDDIIKVDLTEISRYKKLRKKLDEDVIDGKDFTSRLREQFQKITKPPEWSIDIPQRIKDDESSSEEEEDDLLRQTGTLLAKKVSHLPAGIIDIKPLPDGNLHKKAPGVIQSVEFHPSSQVLLTSGLYKTLSLFQIDGETNPVLQSIHLERFPVVTSHFSSNGEEIIMAGQRHWYYVFDMLSEQIIRINEIKGHSRTVLTKFEVSPDNKLLAFVGQDGYILLVSNRTKQWIADLKMNGTVLDISFSPDNRYLLSTGSDGHVYTWDLNTRDCIHRFIDEGCVTGTSIDVSPNNQYIACGSDTGVVNLYDRNCLINQRPTPLKSIMNITTNVDSVNFNHSSEILSISSKDKMGAYKLLHVTSSSVFSNWPMSGKALKTIWSSAFSHDSHYLALGNDQGRALLYRLNHYHKEGTVINN